MLNLNHKKLDIFKKSIQLVKRVYKLSSTLPKEELFGLTSQMKRAAISVPSNIAEGCARKSSIERKRFYEISRSSLVELDTQLEIACELKMLDSQILDELDDNINHVFALLTNLINKS